MVRQRVSVLPQLSHSLINHHKISLIFKAGSEVYDGVNALGTRLEGKARWPPMKQAARSATRMTQQACSEPR